MSKLILSDVKTITEIDVNGYLTKKEPSHWLFDGSSRFICNIFGSICEVKKSDKIKRYATLDIDKAFTNKFYVLKPVNFLDAIKAWDCGGTILRKSDDLVSPTIYVNDGKIDRDDISFDGVQILTGQWFVFVKK